MKGTRDKVAALLESLGVGVDGELKDTPRRVAEWLAEFALSDEDEEAEAERLLSTVFEHEHYDELIIVRGVEFVSLCAHHLLPFYGTAEVGYIPSANSPGIVGLSKLARLVQLCTRRITTQERATERICGYLERHLNPLGAMVVLHARHLCMICRGAKAAGSETVTAATRGALRYNAAARAEFLELARRCVA